MNVQTVSQITAQDLVEYLRLPDATEEDEKTLNSLLSIAKAYVSKYTGRSLVELDEFSDVCIVIMVLVQDMWDNRTLYVDNSNVNRVVESILNLHSVNLL